MIKYWNKIFVFKNVINILRKRRRLIQKFTLTSIFVTLNIIGYVYVYEERITSYRIRQSNALKSLLSTLDGTLPINVTIAPHVTCQGADLIIAVPSSRAHFVSRYTIRDTWGSYAYAPANSATLIFFIGAGHPKNVADESVQTFIDQESHLFGDILQGDYIDSYYNLTLKSIHILRWVSLNCPDSKFLLKSDDDMYINVPLLHQTLKEMSAFNYSFSPFIVGHIVYNGTTERDVYNKFYTSESLYNSSKLPTYASGPAYAMSVPTATLLYKASMQIPLLWLEDVFITGTCADLANVDRVDDARFLSGKREPSGCIFRNNTVGEKFTTREIVKVHREVYDTSLKCE